MSNLIDRVRGQVEDNVEFVDILRKAGMIQAMSPARIAALVDVIRRDGVTATSGIGMSAARIPDNLALVDELGELTWEELDARCRALAAGLAALTPEPVTTIAVLCRNHRGFIEALTAAGKLGADVLLLNTSFAGPQLRGVLEREGADLLIHDQEFDEIVETVADLPEPPLRVHGWTDTTDLSVPTMEGIITANMGRDVPKPERNGRVVLLTSGTTGTPKGAKRSSGGGINQLAQLLERIPWRYGEKMVIPAPMFHAFGFGQMVIACTMGNTIITRRRFDPEATLEMLAVNKAEGLAVVPVMIERIVDLPEDVKSSYDVSNLRMVTASGSKMRPDAVISFMDSFGDTIYNGYNSTEVGMISTATPADLRVAPDTAGKPMLGTEIRILDDDRNDVAPGEIGVVFVKNSTMFEGYTSGDNKDFVDGYMASGDLGRLDEEGRLYVVGRDDDMIISGGENVYPLEVEQTLAGHDAVKEAVVIGVPDEQFGQRLVGFVTLHEGASTDESELRTHVKAELASYKVPRTVTILDEFPRNATGKILKRDLPVPGA